MYKITINDEKAFEVALPGTLDGASFQPDLHALGQGRFHLVHEGHSWQAELVSADYKAKALVLKINGRTYRVQAKDRFDQLLDQMGLKAQTEDVFNELKAPMPGLIMEIKVVEGQAVQKGDPLLILEAMKMENVIKSPGEGTVQRIHIRQGQSVEKNQVLMQF